MKKVLVTGAGGTIGLNLIKYLLAEGKYEITALDLKNKQIFKRLKKYNKRINIIYSDVLDCNLIDALVKEHDVVIHLASCLPPFSEYKKGLSDIIDYNSTENIVRSISFYNPKCYLIYASTTSLYEGESTSSSPVKVNEGEYFNKAKYKSEKLIIKKLKNYTIIRVPLVLGDLRSDNFIYNLSNGDLETITKEDAAYAFCKCIDKEKELSKKVINIGGGETCRINSKELFNNILKYHGISYKYILNRLFGIHNYDSPYLLDSDKSNEILEYRNDSIQSYFMRQKRRSYKRKLPIFFAKINLFFRERKNK